MNETFASDAKRIAGTVCRWLSWRPADLWDATPAEIAMILTPDVIGDDAALSRRELVALMEHDANG